MTSKEILKLYNNAIRITSTGREWNAVCKDWLAIPSRERLMSFDTETTGVEWGVPSYFHADKADYKCKSPTAFGASFCLDLGNKVAIVWTRLKAADSILDFFPKSTSDKCLFVQAVNLLSEAGTKVAHNVRYDLRILSGTSLKIREPVECTYTMSRIYWDRRKKHDLQKLSEVICPELSDWEEPVKKELTRLRNQYTRAGNPKDYVNYSFLPEEIIRPYAMTDAFMCLMLYKHLWPHIEKNFLEVYNREKKVFHIINKVEATGMAFDSKKAKRKATPLQRNAHQSHLKMEKILGHQFNPRSHQKMPSVLRELGIPEKMFLKKGKVTTEAPILMKALDKLKGDKKLFIKHLLDYRAYDKIINTYLLPLTERAELNNGIVLTSINPTDSRTGRMASRNPNLQNIPNPTTIRSESRNPVRACFICRPSCHNYYFDYSQMEMAVFGWCVGDTDITEGYAEGLDLHKLTASQVYDLPLKDVTGQMRTNCKAVNFGIIYGEGATGLSRELKIPLQKAKILLNTYYAQRPSVREFQEQSRGELQLYSYVEDWFGKRYHIPPSESHKAVNAVVQGGCAQIFKIALINLNECLEGNIFGSRIILPLHDEFQIESKVWVSPHDETHFCRKIIECMVNIPQLLERDFRLRVDVKKSKTNWAEKKKFKI